MKTLALLVSSVVMGGLSTGLVGLGATQEPASASTPPTAPANSVQAWGSATSAPPATLPADAQPVVGMAATPDGGGYWVVASDGGVFAFGDAAFHGSLGGTPLIAPVVGMAATPDGGGYWLVASDGGVFAFGDAAFHQSMGGTALVAPVVGMASTPDGGGYWLVASDGGVFAFGDAVFHQSMGGTALAAPVVGMAATPDGGGYWLVGADGGVFAFGDAAYFGSMGGTALVAPVVGMAATPDGGGYWLVGADGGVFAFGDAAFLGTDTAAPGASAVAIVAAAQGYWVAFGSQLPFGQDVAHYLAGRQGEVTVAAYDAETGETFVDNPGAAQVTASIVKVDILATLLAQAQASGATLSPGQQSVAQSMIEISDNDSATTLFDDVGGAPALAAFDARVGMPDTSPNASWGLTTTTAADQVRLVRDVAFRNALLTDASRQFELGLMENVESDQRWGVSGGVPGGVTVALKNGWLPLGDDDWQINSDGWVDGDGRDYVISVLTTGDPTMGYGIQTIEGVSGLVWSALGPR